MEEEEINFILNENLRVDLYMRGVGVEGLGGRREKDNDMDQGGDGKGEG